MVTFCVILSLLFSFGFVVARAADNSLNYVEVVVKPGDTLWGLAEEYGPSKQDIRKTIFMIKKINELGSVAIYPDQVILVPIR